MTEVSTVGLPPIARHADLADAGKEIGKDVVRKLHSAGYGTKVCKPNYQPNERESLFLHGVVELGLSSSEAAAFAGYKDKHAGQAKAYKLQPLIVKMMSYRLTAGAPVALKTMEDIMKKDDAPPMARLKAAEMWLDRSGWNKTVDVNISDTEKSLEEKSVEELRSEVQAKLEKLKGHGKAPIIGEILRQSEDASEAEFSETDDDG
jgi:hypothetical protein